MLNRINVMFLTGSMAIGGAERLLLDLLSHINRSQFNPHLYYYGKVKENSFLEDFRAIKDLNLVIRPVKKIYDPRLLFSIINYIHKNEMDVIHTHLINADIIGRLSGYLSGVPVISTLHNDPRTYEIRRIDQRVLAKLTARYLTDYSVAVSQHIRDLFVQRWNISPEKIGIIYNGIDLGDFLQISPGKRIRTGINPITITNIGRLSQQKAQDVLLYAAKSILEKYPSTHFNILGTGPLYDDLNRLAASLGISKNVDFLGLRRDVPSILSRTDVFVLSSLWEGLPLSAVEAMAAARPVILTDVGGNSELIESGKHGFLVPPGDPIALANAASLLIQDEPKRVIMGKAGRERVLSKFNITKMTRDYESLYRSLTR